MDFCFTHALNFRSRFADPEPSYFAPRTRILNVSPYIILGSISARIQISFNIYQPGIVIPDPYLAGLILAGIHISRIPSIPDQPGSISSWINISLDPYQTGSLSAQFYIFKDPISDLYQPGIISVRIFISPDLYQPGSLSTDSYHPGSISTRIPIILDSHQS